jgi:MFS family permease
VTTTLGPTLVPAARRASRQGTLMVAVSATFTLLACYTLPVTTLGPTASTLHANTNGQAWILSSMSLGLAAALLVTGAIADDHGRRRVFVAGAALLAASSVLAAVAPTTLVLVIARLLQGVGGAALTACSLGLLAHAYPEPAQRTRVTGIWGASLGAGIAVGPLLASGLNSLSGWRASYWCIAALAAVICVAAQFVLEESSAADPRPVDYLGGTLLTLGISGLLAGLVEGRDGWTRPVTVLLLGGGVALLASFWRSQANRSAAMLDPSLFRNRAFVAATAGAVANGLGSIALMSFVPSLIERGLQQSILTAALVLLAWSGVSVVTALLARRLPPTLHPHRQMAAALLAIGIGQLLLTGMAPDSSALRLVPGLVLAGIGSGVLNANLARQAVASVPAGRAAVGSGANNTARYIGAAIGITVVVIIAGGSSPADIVSGWNCAALVTAGWSLLGALAITACRT